MKNSVRTLAALMAAVCVLGCSKEADNHIEEPVEKEKEPVVIEKVPMTFSVGTAKTVLIPRTDQSGFNIGFHKVDEISIFDCNGDNNDFVNDASNDGQLEVKFSGKAAKSDIYYALYPYQSGAELDENKIKIKNVALPAIQTATANSFDPKANISVDKASGNTLCLKNVCSLFKIVVYAGEHYDKAVISNNDGSPICGTLSISFEDGNPVVGEDIKDESSSVTLSGAMGDDTEQTVYYAVILPKTYAKGFTVRLYKDGVEGAVAMKYTSSSVTIGRAKIGNFGHIEAGLLLPGVFTVNSEGKKVQFARGNLWCDETTSPKTYGFENNQYEIVFGEATPDATSHRTHFFKGNYRDSKTSNMLFANPDSEINPYKGWETLTNDEWSYLLGLSTSKRSCTNKYANAVVAGNPGLLIFPDDNKWPDGVTMPTEINEPVNFKSKAPQYTLEEFSKLEQSGFVFLAGQGRLYKNTSLKYVYDCLYDSNNGYGYGRYVTSDMGNTNVKFLNFSHQETNFNLGNAGNYGYSIRLVCPVAQ